MKKIVLIFLFIFSPFLGAEPLFKSLEGQSIPLSSLKGKWVFINYWAEWCDTCLAEIPEFNKFFKKNRDKNVVLFAVNFDRKPAYEQQIAMERNRISYPALIGNPARDLGLGHIPGVPVTFVLNPEGNLVKTLMGGQSERELNAAME